MRGVCFRYHALMKLDYWIFKKFSQPSSTQELRVKPNRRRSQRLSGSRSLRRPGSDPGNYFGGQTKVPNRKLRTKPESRARSARVPRAKPESRTRSARELRAKPETRAKPEKSGGRGLGRGLGEPLPRKFLKNQI